MEMLKVRDRNVLAIRTSLFSVSDETNWLREPFNEAQLSAAENCRRCDEMISKYPCISTNVVKRVYESAELESCPDCDKRLLYQLALGWIVWDSSQNLSVEDFFNHVGLVNEADDAHLSLAFGTNKRVCFINFSDEVGPALF